MKPLKELGLSDRDIGDLFELVPREDNFYTKKANELISYSRNSVESTALGNENEISINNTYNGTPPISSVVMPLHLCL